MKFIELFSLEFLNKSYLDIIGNLSGKAILAFGIAIMIALLGSVIEKKHDSLAQIIYVLAAIIIFLACVALCFGLVMAVTYPAFYAIGLLKDLFVSRYLYTPELLTFNRELLITILCGLVVSIPYCWLISKGLRNFAD